MERKAGKWLRDAEKTGFQQIGSAVSSGQHSAHQRPSELLFQ